MGHFIQPPNINADPCGSGSATLETCVRSRNLSYNSERFDLGFGTDKPVFVERDKESIDDWSLKKERSVNWLKLDFTTHGIIESLSEFGLCWMRKVWRRPARGAMDILLYVYSSKFQSIQRHLCRFITILIASSLFQSHAAGSFVVLGYNLCTIVLSRNRTTPPNLGVTADWAIMYATNLLYLQYTVFWAPNGIRLTARCYFTGLKKLSSAQPPPTCPRKGYARIQNIMHGLYKS